MANLDIRKPDQTKMESFAEKMMDTLNGASLGLMISVGHRTGLFDTMAGMPPATSEEIAARARLNERYVREWLATMWGEEKAREMLREAGFNRVEVRQLPHDFQNSYYVCTKDRTLH